MARLKHVIDALDDLDPSAVDRLLRKNGVSGGSRADKLKKLSKSYSGSAEDFYGDLRKKDIATIFKNTIEIDGCDYNLPKASSYSKEELVDMAVKTFVYDVPPAEFVGSDDEDEDRYDAYGDLKEEDYPPPPPPPPPRSSAPGPTMHEHEVLVLKLAPLKWPATTAEIRGARRKLAAITAPDLNPGKPTAAHMMVLINDGCDRLEKRASS